MHPPPSQTTAAKLRAELRGVAGGTLHAAILVLFVAAALGIGQTLGARYWLGALLVGGALCTAALGVALASFALRPTRPVALRVER